MLKIRFLILFFLIFTSSYLHATTEQVAIDSRIRTLIYTPNQVFTVEANYGYQSFIEFEYKERVKTIAVGDSVSWNLVPAGNKIFLKPYQKSGRTNMTVITDKRTYMFDLIAKNEDENTIDPSLTYAVRFYYPSSKNDSEFKAKDSFSFNGKLYELNYHNLNRNYSISGNESISPAEIFDNSHVTFFKFKNDKIPQIFSINKDKSETKLKMIQFKNYIVINNVYEALDLRYKNLSVKVFNNSHL